MDVADDHPDDGGDYDQDGHEHDALGGVSRKIAVAEVPSETGSGMHLKAFARVRSFCYLRECPSRR
jgi:hypothetical protein